MRNPETDPYTEEELAQIQALAERIEREKAANQKREPNRREKRTAVRAQAKRNRAATLTTIADQGPGIWLEEQRRKRGE